LQAYLDILEYDGMKSVLREADMLQIKDNKNVDPNETIDFFSFKKIITAQELLLYGCYRLQYELGKKFAFYLFPWGKPFEEIIREITVLVKTKWAVQIIDQGKTSVTVEIQNCIFCSDVGVPCNFFTGFLVNSLKKAIPDNRRVIYTNEKEEIPDLTHNPYILKLIWKK
jgi:predicted hydrocarbon binding protein